MQSSTGSTRPWSVWWRLLNAIFQRCAAERPRLPPTGSLRHSLSEYDELLQSLEWNGTSTLVVGLFCKGPGGATAVTAADVFVGGIVSYQNRESAEKG